MTEGGRPPARATTMAGEPASAAAPAFLAGGGACGALIASRNWSGSPLGPLDAWPQSLRTATAILLRSPVPMVMLWGEDGVMLYNDAYSVFAGGRHPKLLGSPVREGWPEVAEFNDNVMRVGLAGGTLAYKDMELTLYRHGRPEQVFMNLDYSPVPGDDGQAAGVLAIVIETTERVAAEREQSFLVALGDALRNVSDPVAVTVVAAEHLGRHLGVGRAGYGEIDPSGEVVSVARDWSTEAMSSLAGEARILDAFGPEVIAELRAGRTLAVEDCRTDPRTRDPAHLPTWDSIGTRALIVAPLLSAERLVAIVYAHSAAPRQWSALEASLVEDVGERTWAAVERARAEAAARASEARFEAITNSVDQMIWSTRPDGHHDYYNDRWYDYTGVPPGSTDGEAWNDVFHPDDQERAWAVWQHSLATGESYHIEYRLRHRSGQYRWVLGRAQPVRDEVGRITRWYGTCTDIQDLVEAREVLARSREELERLIEARTQALQAAHARQRAMFDTTRQLIGVLDLDGRLMDANRAALAAIGAPLSDVVGQPIWDAPWFAGTPGMPDIVREGFRAARAGRTVRTEVALDLPDGSTRIYDFAMAPVRDEGGRVIEIVPEATDITEQRRAEEQLRQSQKMEAVGQLTGGIAHDFNNMLAAVVGALDLLGRRIGTADPRARRYVDAANEGARRAALLTQRLLAFSRQQPLRPEPIDANKLMAAMSELIRRSLGSGIQMETVLASGLWRTHADPNQLENVLLNLAVNARDAMPDGGRLTIETQNAHLDARYAAANLGVTAGQYVLIAVTDTGSGMTSEVIAKAFDPFFTTKEVGRGTGLGLSQVYGFVKQSGGHVKIYSEPGEGTSVKVYLPRHLAAAAEAFEEEDALEVPLGESQEVILVVEDEPVVRQVTVDALAELGYRVLEADGAAAALRMLEAHPEVALLFTDIVMPEINGRKLADEARRRQPDLRVLFTTGYTRNAVVHNGVLDPGVELIGKPFTIEELAARVREVLDAPPGAASPRAPTG